MIPMQDLESGLQATRQESVKEAANADTAAEGEHHSQSGK